MKQLRFLLLFALVGTACSPSSKPATSAAEFTADDSAAIRGVIDDYGRAFLANDYASVVALFTPDYVMTYPVASVGREAALELFQGLGVDFTSGTYDLKRLEGSGSLAYGWFEFNGRYTTDGGEGRTESGNGLWVFKKGADGKWEIVAESYQGVGTPDTVAS